jgi:hypothetical protein
VTQHGNFAIADEVAPLVGFASGTTGIEDFSLPTRFHVEFVKKLHHSPIVVQASYWERDKVYYSFITEDNEAVAEFRIADVFAIVKVGHASA